MKKGAKKNGKEIVETETVSISSDGKQLVIRIPNKFSESANISKKKDKFIFSLHLSSTLTAFKKPKLFGELKRGET